MHGFLKHRNTFSNSKKKFRKFKYTTVMATYSAFLRFRLSLNFTLCLTFWTMLYTLDFVLHLLKRSNLNSAFTLLFTNYTTFNFKINTVFLCNYQSELTVLIQKSIITNTFNCVTIGLESRIRTYAGFFPQKTLQSNVIPAVG